MQITTIGKGTALPNGDISMAQPEDTGHPVHMAASITSETALERTLLADRRLQAGLNWGAPRFGHPEGHVRAHVAAMLAAIRATTRSAMTCGSSPSSTTPSNHKSSSTSHGPLRTTTQCSLPASQVATTKRIET